MIFSLISCPVREGQAIACPTRQKGNDFSGEKRDAAFHLQVFRYAPDRTVFSAAVNKKI